ncbi:hypothetical protein M378DRAFT_160039 [Amanita muscaria Koide BX008]|uniref:Uncharacterized protein n=1 Tax=Amanita muscaria (strain Koide BX008) TaxID=946122 RepID=A0A0C2WZ30_AMAMK|nr:hypothetical protein M378DRAFT_160039 [Amanita muscaria Koide BX008]
MKRRDKREWYLPGGNSCFRASCSLVADLRVEYECMEPKVKGRTKRKKINQHTARQDKMRIYIKKHRAKLGNVLLDGHLMFTIVAGTKKKRKKRTRTHNHRN